MEECWIIYDNKTGKVYSESEFMWSHCVGTFYTTQEAATTVIERDGLDKSHVGTIHLYKY